MSERELRNKMQAIAEAANTMYVAGIMNLEEVKEACLRAHTDEDGRNKYPAHAWWIMADMCHKDIREYFYETA